MTGPGGDEVGRVSVRVVPNTDGFRRQLQRELAAIERSLKLKIPVELGDIDAGALRAQLAALEQSRVTIPVDIGDGTEIERLRARLQALDSARVDIPVNLDVRDLERADAVLRRLDGRSIRMNVRLNGVRQAIRDLTALDALVRRLDGRRINIGIDVDAGAAIAQIAAIEAALAGVRASLGSIGSGGGGGAFGSGSPLLRGAASFVGLLLQAGALALGLSVAGAAITAAWGAAATAIAVLPSALALVGIPLGLLLLNFESLGKTITKITPAFQKFRQATSQALAEGLAPALENFATQVLPKVQTGVTNIARTMGQMAQQAVSWLATTQGTELLNSVLANVDNTLKSMSTGLGNIGRGFFELAAQSSTFDVLSGAVNEFGASFRANVTELIGDGTLDRAMRGLRDMLVELGQGFSDLVTNGLKVFAAAAPGVNKFLDSLTRFFNRFNWDRLGAAVGNVFRGLGEALDGIDPGTITAIEDAFVRLGDLFRDQKFQDDLKGMVEGLPAIIDQIRAFASDFAAAGAAISDAIQGFNTADQKFREFVNSFNQSAVDLGKDLGLNGPGTIGDWLRNLDDDFDRWLGILPPKAEELGSSTREGWERGLRGGGGSFGPKTGSFGDWLPDLGQMFKDLFGPAATSLGTLLTDLQTKVRDGMRPLAETARLAMEQVRLAVQTGLTLLLPVVTVGLLGMQTAFTNSFLAIGAAVSLGMNTLVNTLTLGFVLMQTAVANGMLLLQTAFTTGWALIQLAVDNGLLLMRTAVSEGFLQMQTDATNGMLLFAAAVLAGFALVVPAVTVGMAQIVLAVQLGFQQIVSAVQTGMQQVTDALQLNWSTAVSATQTAMQQMESAAQVGMSNIVVHVRDGMQQATDAVTAGMDLMHAEVERGMSDAEAAVKQGIARMISALKASVGQFRDAGAQMGQGLVDGLRSKMGAVQQAARDLANAAASALRAAAAIRSPSRVFIGLGEQMGAGLAIGLAGEKAAIIREAEAIVDGMAAEFQKVDHHFGTELDAKVKASVASSDQDTSVIRELQALRGDGASPIWAAQLITELRGLRRDVTNARMGAAAAAQADRRTAELGAFI